MRYLWLSNDQGQMGQIRAVHTLLLAEYVPKQGNHNCPGEAVGDGDERIGQVEMAVLTGVCLTCINALMPTPLKVRQANFDHQFAQHLSRARKDNRMDEDCYPFTYYIQICFYDRAG
jgi:hypothetical protein